MKIHNWHIYIMNYYSNNKVEMLVIPVECWVKRDNKFIFFLNKFIFFPQKWLKLGLLNFSWIFLADYPPFWLLFGRSKIAKDLRNILELSVSENDYVSWAHQVTAVEKHTVQFIYFVFEILNFYRALRIWWVIREKTFYIPEKYFHNTWWSQILFKRIKVPLSPTISVKIGILGKQWYYPAEIPKLQRPPLWIPLI